VSYERTFKRSAHHFVVVDDDDRGLRWCGHATSWSRASGLRRTASLVLAAGGL